MLPTSTPAITSLDANLIQSTFLIIKQKPDEFATSFYQILFDKYPKVRSLFSETDMEKQKTKLLESLDLVLVSVHSPEAFTPILIALGKRHVKYGAVLTDYPLIGDALLQALEKHLGENWNSEVKQAWSLAYQTIADIMAEGAKSAMDNDAKVRVTWETNDRLNTPAAPAPRASKTSASTLVTIVCVGIVAVCGYAVWNLLQAPSSDTSTPASISGTNR